nr:MAG TPA: hypothetical protein [Caudoviricetes sp.]
MPITSLSFTNLNFYITKKTSYLLASLLYCV